MRHSVLILFFVMSAARFVSAQEGIKFIYDQRPDADIPREARAAGTKPDSDSIAGSKSNISFRLVTDLKDYGPLHNVVTKDIYAISVRYYDSTFKNIRDVETYLTSVLQFEKGTTNAFCPWSEALPVPSVEATLQFLSGGRGKWLLWRQGRSAYQDPKMKWWFSYGW